MSMTKMDDACYIYASSLTLNEDYFVLDALNAGNTSLELLSDIFYGYVEHSEVPNWLREKIVTLLDEWN